MARLNGSRIAGVLADAFAVRTSTATQSSPHAQHGQGHPTLTGEDAATGAEACDADASFAAAVESSAQQIS